MRTDVPKNRRRSRIGLGLSVVAAVVAFAYLTLRGDPVNGALLGLLLIGAGIWEYRRKLSDLRAAVAAESEGDAGSEHGDFATRNPGDSGTQNRGDAEVQNRGDAEVQNRGDPEVQDDRETGAEDSRVPGAQNDREK